MISSEGADSTPSQQLESRSEGLGAQQAWMESLPHHFPASSQLAAPGPEPQPHLGSPAGCWI